MTLMKSVVDRIFEYNNYRLFIKDYFCEQKQLKEVFSHRFFAFHAGFSSSGFCAHVMKGKRNLTPESIQKMIKGIGLSENTAIFFKALVNYNQAKTLEDRQTTTIELQNIRKIFSKKRFKGD